MNRSPTRRHWWRLILLALLAAAVFAIGAYFSLNAWLASAGGRDAVAAELSKRSGVPVSLTGDFDVMLWPAIGAAGTKLEMGQPGGNGVFLSSGVYEVAVALRPLLDRRLVIETVRLANGVIFPDRITGSANASTDGRTFTLPDIDQLQVENFELVIPGQSGARLTIDALTLSSFSPGRPTPFAVSVKSTGHAKGQITWNDSLSSLALALDGTLDGFGPVSLQTHFSIAKMTGDVRATWNPSGQASPVRLSSDFAYLPELIRFENIQAEIAGQSMSGAGCLVRGETSTLNLDLAAGAVDLDAIIESLPAGLIEGTEQGNEPGPGVNLRLEAKELKGQGALVWDAVLHVGQAPDCGPAN